MQGSALGVRRGRRRGWGGKVPHVLGWQQFSSFGLIHQGARILNPRGGDGGCAADALCKSALLESFASASLAVTATNACAAASPRYRPDYNWKWNH